jgi:RimJ/RimL family protein N-acetyltransferase
MAESPTQPGTAAITIRPAREGDRAALEHIAARTWDGDDYLPGVISDWLADPEGGFYVAALPAPGDPAGQVVGAGKLTRLGPGEWWLEGLRVDPDHYGHGIGRLLNRYGVEQALASGETGVVRFCTSAENAAIGKLAAETGFAEAGRALYYHAAANPIWAGGFRRATADEAEAFQTFLGRSAHFEAAAQSAIDHRWQCKLITPARLADWAARGWLYGWHGRRHDPARLDGMVIARADVMDDGAGELTVTYLDAIPGAVAILAQTVRGLAAELGCATLWHMAHHDLPRLVALEQAGWRRPADNGGKAVLYSRALGA